MAKKGVKSFASREKRSDKAKPIQRNIFARIGKMKRMSSISGMMKRR